MIQLSNLSILYGNKLLIENCEFEAKKGCITAITGPSGSGKTTLLDYIILNQIATNEEYCLDGKKIDFNDPKQILELQRNHFSCVFQDDRMLGNMSIADHFQIAAKLHSVRLSKNEMKDILQRVSLEYLSLKQPVSKLSGGEKQRLAIACALAKNTEIIIADEPTGSLDHENEKLILDLLIDLAHNMKKCVIIATHSRFVLEKVDEVFIIEDHTIHSPLDHDGNNIQLEKKKIDHRFYSLYLKSSNLIRNYFYLIFLLLLSITIGTYVLSKDVSKAMIDANEQELQNDIVSDLRITSKSAMTMENIDYFLKFDHVKYCDYYYTISSNELEIHNCLSYMDSLEDNEILITPSLAEKYQLSVGDSYYLSAFDSTFVVKRVLEEEIEAFGGLDQYIVYVSDELFKDQTTNKLLLHIDSFMYMDSVIEQIETRDLNIKIDSINHKYSIYTDMQKELTEHIQSISKAALLILIGMITYIEILDLKRHQYDFALLKANGLSKMELNRLFILRGMILDLCMILITSLIYIIASMICYYAGKIVSIQLISGLKNIIILCTLLEIIPLAMMLILLQHIQPIILMKH